MNTRNSVERFGSVARAFHWTMALLLVVSLTLIEIRGWLPKGHAARGGLRDWHSQIGLVVFALVWFRLYWRLVNVEPAIVPSPTPWQRRAAHAVEWTFYALLFTLPILGIVMMQADGKTVGLLGVSLPSFIAVDKPWAHQLEGVHEWLGNAMMALIAAHVGAAFWHRVVRRDNTLARMW
jgi:cytochrome b561